jgi:CheY-like chemotaxis protein
MKPRVLFAEDDVSIRESFTAILNLEGAAVTACASALEACRQLSVETYDLVITDMRMETPTAGWSVVRAARAAPEPPNVAVMTAFPIPRSDLRQYRIQTVLTKGMPTSKMIGRLRELIQQSAHPPKKDAGRDRSLSRH